MEGSLRSSELETPVGVLTENRDPQWYAAYTLARHEKKVADKLQTHSVKCFLPCYSTIHRWKDRSVKLQLPLFPGYVFVQLALRDRMQVLHTPGVVRLVGNGNTPVALPECEVEALREAADQKIPTEPHFFLDAGRRVRIVRGAFQGLEAILVRKENQLRAVLSLELIRASFSLVVDAADIEPTLPV